MKNTRKNIFLALLIAVGIVLGIFENSLPVPIPVPGAKLGLANIVQLVIIVMIGYREAVFVAIIRTLVVAIGTGSVSALMYSMPSAIVSTVFMIIFYRFLRNKFSIMGISIVGALTHNLTQIVIACLILSNFRIAIYYPYMALISLVSGYFTGVAVYFFKKNTVSILSFEERE